MSNIEMVEENNHPCACNYEYDAALEFPDKHSTPSIVQSIIKVDYGEIRIGHEKSTRVSITNHTDTVKVYIIKYNPSTIPIYQSFTTPKRSISLNPRETIKIKITYKPLMPWSVDYDFMNIVSNDEDIRVELSGKSIGPKLVMSTTLVTFHTWPSKETSTKSVEISNESTFPVEFKFDLDEFPNRIFDVVPRAGFICGKRHVIITITFRAPTYGEYIERMFCMVHNQHPLIVDCFGAHFKSKEERIGKQYVKHPEIVENNYNRYMRDVQMALLRQKKPAFSFIDAYLNYGTIEFNSNNKKELTLVTTLTNHREQNVLVKWYTDDLFVITPAIQQILPNESVLFECIFRPMYADQIYSRHLLFNVFYTEIPPGEDIPMPVAAVLRVLGHTFNEPDFWVPQFQVNPGTVILPPVMPGGTCFSTLELRSGGYLPTSYKFVSPTSSNFLVKPMIGSVRGLDIVVIQLLSIAKPKLYTEQWHIILNDDKKHTIPICFKGYAEYPSVRIGDNNTITIKGVQIGSEEIVDVIVYNTCQLHVHYEFMLTNFPENLKFLTPKGSIAPNLTDTIKLSYKSTQRFRGQFTVTCLVYATREHQLIDGLPEEISVAINLETDYSEICCLPSHHDFGTVECFTAHTSEFCAFNYGLTTIHYKLSVYWQHVMETYAFATVTPVYGTLAPKSHVHCVINFSARVASAQFARVCYELRPNSNSLETVPDTIKFIYQFKAKVCYPYFQITDIADHNFGHLFSERSLWEGLNINWLNYALAEMQHNESAMCIDLNLPDAEMNAKHFYVTLMARNVTQFPVQLSLKRRKLCDCKLQEVGASLSIRNLVYQCPHRQMCKLSIMDETILPHKEQIIKLIINYNEPGEYILAYDLNLNKSTLTLNFKLHTIDVDKLWLSKYTASFSMLYPSVCLNTKQPPLQVFWFYNNTSKTISYELSLDSFNEINKAYQFEVWKCFNPRGSVEAYRAYPLWLQYRPLQKKSSLMKIPLHMSNGIIVNLKIRGRGSRSSIPNKIPKLYLPHTKQALGAVHLSMNRLRIDSFPVWSSTTRMVFITNTSDDILGYNWIKTELPELCCVEVMDPNRVLRPNQTDMLIVKITSFENPCTTRIHLPCQIVSHTKYLQHKKSVQDYQQRQKQIEDEFIITSEGVSFPENHVVILPKPEVVYNTMAIEIEIKSFIDRDAVYSAKKQFKQEPTAIFSSTIDTLPHKQNQSTIAFLYKPDSTTKSSSSYNDDLYVEKNPYEFDPKVDNVEFYRQAVEALLADAIFSDRFRSVLDVQKEVPPVYYSQIRRNYADSFAEDEVEENTNDDLEQQLADMYNEPQMPFVKELLHGMLLKSFEEIFTLRTNEHDAVIDYKEEVEFPTVCKCEPKIPTC